MYKTFFVFVLIFLSSCFANSGLKTYSEKEHIKILNGKLEDIKITDLRIDTTSKKIQIPLFTMPGMNNEISPTLQEKDIKIIKTEIEKHFNGNIEKKYTVEIIIKNATIGFRSSFNNEKEFSNIDIDIITTEVNGTIIKKNSNAWLERKSIDASPKFLAFMFEQNLRMVIKKCFDDN